MLVDDNEVNISTLADFLNTQNFKVISVKSGVDFLTQACLLYTSDAADERSSVDLGGRRIINKKKKKKSHTASSLKNLSRIDMQLQ